ncbi:Gpi1-domain-containing protein [Obba rivulosa]|uniref:Gpi1-domain-containing protein n=1 Tax=Obba rivulosa TaxID=1052685 RepID=A0A8E2DQE8_9APHY|nr:Gpi1-domain-containing protein [Obba rivulosa]
MVSPAGLCHVVGNLVVHRSCSGYSKRDHAEAILHDATRTKEWLQAKHANPDLRDPVILGRFMLEKASPGDHAMLPEIDLYPAQSGLLKRPPLIVLYRRPRRELMQFYALDHRELDILPSQQHSRPDPSANARHATFLEADFTRPKSDGIRALDSSAVLQLNLAKYLADIIQASQSASSGPIPLGTIPPYPSPVMKHATTPVHITGHSHMWMRLPPLLRGVSATVEQFDVRFEQAQFVFSTIPTLWRKRKQFITVRDISRYVRFYNCVWLVLNDVIIGVAFGSFLCENRLVLSRILEFTLQHYLVEWIQDALMWLNNWPAGLKLNTELSSFVFYIFMTIVKLWARVLIALAPYYPVIFWLAGAMGWFGMTAIISLLADLLRFFTAHLWVCYWLSAIVFRHQLGFIGSLWNLFRGKRYNVLRKRLESWDYDIDQLLLGTILFTLVTFLYPTMLAYYALFATTRLLTIIVHAALDTSSALLNHFPLFALMLRIKDPLRLPGGIMFLRSLAGSLMLQNEAAPLSFVFRHYADLGSRLISHYHPVRLMRLLISGRPVQPIQHTQIRFSMIPTTDSASMLTSAQPVPLM